MSDVFDSPREVELQRIAQEHGLRLSKSRNPGLPDDGLYALFNDECGGGTVNPVLANRWSHSWTLDDVEAYFADCRRGRLDRPH